MVRNSGINAGTTRNHVLAVAAVFALSLAALSPRQGLAAGALAPTQCAKGTAYDARSKKCVAVKMTKPSQIVSCPSPSQIAVRMSGPSGWSNLTVSAGNIYLAGASATNPGDPGSTSDRPRLRCRYRTGNSASESGWLPTMHKLLDLPGYRCVFNPPGNAMSATGVKCDLP